MLQNFTLFHESSDLHTLGENLLWAAGPTVTIALWKKRRLVRNFLYRNWFHLVMWPLFGAAFIFTPLAMFGITIIESTTDTAIGFGTWGIGVAITKIMLHKTRFHKQPIQ